MSLVKGEVKLKLEISAFRFCPHQETPQPTAAALVTWPVLKKMWYKQVANIRSLLFCIFQVKTLSFFKTMHLSLQAPGLYNGQVKPCPYKVGEGRT